MRSVQGLGGLSSSGTGDVTAPCEIFGSDWGARRSSATDPAAKGHHHMPGGYFKLANYPAVLVFVVVQCHLDMQPLPAAGTFLCLGGVDAPEAEVAFGFRPSESTHIGVVILAD